MLSKLSLGQYARFFLVGAAVGLSAIALREWIALALPSDTPVYYSASVLIVYTIGIAASYILHHGFTFRSDDNLRNPAVFLPFVTVALAGAASTWGLSLLFRYRLGFGDLFGPLGASAAFALATLISSLVTYTLNALLVFRRN